MKRGLVAVGVAALLLLTGCSTGEASAQPVPTVTETVRVPAPDFTPQDNAAVATAAGVSEFAVRFTSTYERDTGATLTPEESQKLIDSVCDELAAGTAPENVSALDAATDTAVRTLLVETIDKRHCTIR